MNNQPKNKKNAGCLWGFLVLLFPFLTPALSGELPPAVLAGMVLVIAILTIPASIASRLTRRLSRVALWSILICAVSAWGGIALSYVLNFSAGPMIVLLLSVLYGITVLATGKRDR